MRLQMHAFLSYAHPVCWHLVSQLLNERSIQHFLKVYTTLRNSNTLWDLVVSFDGSNRAIKLGLTTRNAIIFLQGQEFKIESLPHYPKFVMNKFLLSSWNWSAALWLPSMPFGPFKLSCLWETREINIQEGYSYFPKNFRAVQRTDVENQRAGGASVYSFTDFSFISSTGFFLATRLSGCPIRIQNLGWHSCWIESIRPRCVRIRRQRFKMKNISNPDLTSPGNPGRIVFQRTELQNNKWKTFINPILSRLTNAACLLCKFVANRIFSIWTLEK